VGKMASSPVQAVAKETAPEEHKEGVDIPFNSPPSSTRLTTQSADQPEVKSAAIQPPKLTTQPARTDYSVPKTDYSVQPPSPPPTDYSVLSQEDKEPLADVVDLAAVKARLTTQSVTSGAVYDRGKWKRSRIKKGYLIKRIASYLQRITADFPAPTLNPPNRKFCVSVSIDLNPHISRLASRSIVYCRIGAAPHTALLQQMSRQRGSLPPSSPGGASSPLPARDRIDRAAHRRAVCARIEATDSTRLITK
jgi:hypothetical protein